VGPCPTQDNYVTRNGITTDYNFGLEGTNGYFNNYIYYLSGGMNSTAVRTVAKTYNLDGLCPPIVCQGQAGYLYPTLATIADVFNDTMMTTYTAYTYGVFGVPTPTKVMQWDYYTSSATSSPPYAPPSATAATRETDTTLGENVNGARLPTLVTTSDASGMLSQTTFAYDCSGPCLTPITPAAASVPYHNDNLVTGNRGNLTSISRLLLPNTQVTTLLSYDTAGALQSTEDPVTNKTSYGYDATDTFVTLITQPTTGTVQHITQAAYDASTGQVLKQTDQNKQITQYSYDSYGRPQTVTAPSGAVTTWSYPSATETDVSDMQSASVTVSSSTIVDGFGRPSQATKAGTSTGTTYDAFGRVSCVTTPHITGTPASTDGSTCNTLYDQFDRVQTVTDPDNSTTTLSYTDNQVTTTDEVGHKHQYTYNAFGDLISVLEQNNQGALAWETDYTYDGLDRLRGVNQKGDASTSAGWRTRTFNYDALSRLTSQTTPEAGTLTFNTYDGNGNLLLSTDARGLTVQYQYDALNRMTQKMLQNGDTYVYNYDATDVDPYGVGRLTSFTSGTTVGAFFSHDLSGNLSSEIYCMPNDCSYNEVAKATYDYHGNMVSLTYPDGRTLYDNYDTLDRLTATGENSFFTQTVKAAAKVSPTPLFSRPRPYFSSGAYYPAGELNSAVYGTEIQVTAGFNSRQDITSLAYAASQPLWSKSYNWDKNAQNLLSVTDQITGAARTFTYDNVNRLASATDSSGSLSDTYTPDAWGNRQESGTFSFAQPFTPTNQISATGYTYDAAGNLTADGLGNSYSYDADGKMSSSNGAVYTRDPFGQRIVKNYAGAATEYYYFGGQFLATRDPSSSQWTDYIYAGGRLIAEAPSGTTDTVFYRIGDHLDSLAQKTDSTGDLLGTNDISPYGELISNTAADRLLFTQHERDTENGSDATLYRQYASAQGRWLSPDPSGASYDLTDPQSLNRYAYLSGRPLAGVDSLGLDDDDPIEPPDTGIESWFGWLAGFFGFGGGSSYHGNPHSTVNTTIGTPSPDSTADFSVTINVSYSNVGAGPGFAFAPVALTGQPFVFSVYAYAPNNGTFQLVSQTQPCSANPVNAFTLDYSQLLYNGGTQSTQAHIMQRHGNTGLPGVSQYFGNFSQIQNINAATYLFGNQALQGTSVVFQYTFPQPLAPVATMHLGTDAAGQHTSSNRLITKSDCRTVVTSYPF
jgi:RHS repeat-associated protein